VEATSAPSAPAIPSSSFIGRHQFLIYRLFSLAGLMPIGGYLCVHLLVNSTVLDSPATFQTKVNMIHSLGIFLPLVEWVFIFIPIMFHAVVGLMIIAGFQPNTGAYPYGRNIRYTLQRFTGMIAMAFIVWHVIHLHSLFGAPFKAVGGAQFDPHHATSSAAAAIQAALWVKILYAIGTLSAVYHFSNGLFTLGITWGIWTTPKSQLGASRVCNGIGVILAIVGLSALWGMSKVDVEKVQAAEKSMNAVHKLENGQLMLPADLIEKSEALDAEKHAVKNKEAEPVKPASAPAKAEPAPATPAAKTDGK